MPTNFDSLTPAEALSLTSKLASGELSESDVFGVEGEPEGGEPGGAGADGVEGAVGEAPPEAGESAPEDEESPAGELGEEEEPEAELPDDEVEEARPKEKFVDLRALQQERAKRRALQKELEDQKLLMIQLATRMDQMQAKPATAEATQEDLKAPVLELLPVPAKETDLGGYLEAIAINASREIAHQKELAAYNGKLQEQQAKVTNAHTALWKDYETDANKFAVVEPDFWPAYHYLSAIKGKMFMAEGWSKEEATDLMKRGELLLAQKDFKQGKSPAKRLYEAAKALGYKPAPPAGKTAKPIGKGPTVAELAQQAKAAKAGSIHGKGGGGGKAADNSLTVEEILGKKGQEGELAALAFVRQLSKKDY